ncbi:30S ribosomal protein S17 [Candidatus Azambacteria bacterium]|nr:30S ribosomal protein S17 [Candidatus Azambacteria bacterium]
MTEVVIKKRKIKGIVVSDKMTKTVIVEVNRLKKHPKYKKYFKITARFKAHDEKDEYKTGDNVIIEETRPISKEKRWKVVSKI